MAAFAAAFASLPDEVSLWSNRNIYQYQLSGGAGALFGGFNLDAVNRDRGRIGFDLHGKSEPPDHRGWTFGRDDGVKVTKVTPDLYVVYFNRKAVIFRLNQHTGLRPGAASIRSGETYLGSVRDQTGLGFFLIRQEGAKRYFYTLDEALLNEKLEPVADSAQIRIGARSGFAYYRDRYLPRWILIGVRGKYADHDSLYNGPFDDAQNQRWRGGAVTKAIKSRRSGTAGPVERSENLAVTGAGVLVQPYMLYKSVNELSAFDQCAARAGDPEIYYRCFASHQTR